MYVSCPADDILWSPASLKTAENMHGSGGLHAGQSLEDRLGTRKRRGHKEPIGTMSRFAVSELRATHVPQAPSQLTGLMAATRPPLE